MTYSLDQAVAWAKLPVSVRYSPEGDEFIIVTPKRYSSSWKASTARKNYLYIRNRLAAYLPPEPKPGRNVDVVA